MIYAVYHIHVEQSLDSGYIGITKDLSLRWSQHGWNRKQSNPHLRAALAKYGNAIKHSVIAKGLDFDTARWVEGLLRPRANMGWNVAKGGGVPPSPAGKHRSSEYRRNIALAKIGDKNPMFGKRIKFSDEHRRNLSNAIKGQSRPAAKGKNRPSLTCPYCGKSGGDGAMTRWHFERCKRYES